MDPSLDYADSRDGTAIWDQPEPDAVWRQQEPALDLSGKVVFVTVQGMREAPLLAAEYLQADAKLAILDVTEWTLHILSSRDGEILPRPEPTRCASWVAAVEAVIAEFGPIDLWLDTRAMTWPPVSRVGRLS